MDTPWILHGVPMDIHGYSGHFVVEGGSGHFVVEGGSMDNPQIIHSKTDIGVITTWHTMEVEGF